jgi:pimeloyl-ACP methyl ester carboxylesterase/DNA-binding SARP family transcriptional activator
MRDHVAMTVSYRVLGPLEIESPRQPARLGPRLRQLLILLLAAQGNALSPARLADGLWGDDQPVDPEASLHTLVSRLRAVVGNDLVTKTPGYLLEVDPNRLDAARFELALTRARSTPGSPAVDIYREAEREWRGSPYLGYEDFAHAEVIRLERLHDDCVQERLDRMIEAGAAAPALPDIEHMVSEHPLDEAPRSLLMRALHATGRKPDALRAFSEYSEFLAEQTGLEPSADLRELEVAILLDQLEPPLPPRAEPAPRMAMAVSYEDIGAGDLIAIGRAGSGPRLVIHPAWLCKLDLLAAGLDGRSPFISRLAAEFEIVMFDRLGTGMSNTARPNLKFDESVAEFVGVLETIGDSPAAVLASSCAGPIAIAAAAQRPELFGRLILLGTYACGPETFPHDVADSILGLVRASWGMGSQVLASLIFPGAGSEQADGFARFQREAATPEVAEGLLNQMYQADVSGILGEIAVPSLVIHYRKDRAIPIAGGQSLARGIPGARLITLDGINHYPGPADYDRVIQTIHEFLLD